MFRVRFFDKEEVDNNQLKITNLIRNKIESHPRVDKIKTATNVKDYANDALYDYIILQQKSIKTTSEKLQEFIEQIDHLNTNLNLNKCLELFKSFSIQKDIYLDVMTELEEQYKFLDKFISINKKEFSSDIYFQFRLIKHTLYRNIIQKALLDSLVFKMGSAITSEENITNLYENALIDNKRDLKVFEIGKLKSVANFLAGKNDNINDETANIIIGLFNIDLSNEFPFPELEQITPEQKLIENLKRTYTSDKDFTQIRTVGITSENFPTLSMDDYYMDLESVEEQRKGQQYSNKEAYDYIFSNNNRIVITGNPGFGKSTFAKWICHYWAKQDNNEMFIPLYINLSDLKFYKFCIEEFCVATYRIKKENLETIFNAEINVRFILDGLDEINELDKKELNIRLRKLNGRIYSNYILLSRSYSLLYTIFFDPPNLNLIGFNNTSREIYLEKISRLSSNNKVSFEILNAQIRKQNALQNLFNNPLILSFVIQIFLNDPGFNFYSKFSTKYQIYKWILKRNVKHEIENHRLIKEEWYNLHTKICKLSFDLLIDNQNTYTSDMLDPNHESVILLSKIGFGNLIELEDKKWKFKFHSITTQEFLAAIHLSKNLQVKTIKYLLKFENYQELLSMAIESEASYPVVKKFLSKTIHIIKTNSKKQKNFFLIVSYLSEQNLNKYWNYKNLHKLFIKDSSNEVSRLISKIYRKLNSSKREYITNLILNTLKTNLKTDINTKTIITQHKSIKSMMQCIAQNKFYKDSIYFTEGLPFVLEILNSNLKQIINNDMLKSMIYDFSEYHIKNDTMKLPTEKIQQIIGKDRYESMFYLAKRNSDSDWVYNEIERIKVDELNQPHISINTIDKIQSLVLSLAQRNIKSSIEDKRKIYNYIFSIFKLLKSLNHSTKGNEKKITLSKRKFSAREYLKYIDIQIELEYISYRKEFNILTKEEDINDLLNLCYNQNKIRYMHIIDYFIYNYGIRNIPPKHADLYLDHIEHETLINNLIYRVPSDKNLHKKMIERVSISECIKTKNMLPNRCDHIIEFEPKYFDEIISIFFDKVPEEQSIWYLFRFLACIKLSFFLRNKNKVISSLEKSLSLLITPTDDVLDAIFNFLTLIIKTKSKLHYPLISKINETLKNYKRTNYITKYYFKEELNITYFPCSNCRNQPCEYYNRDGFGCEIFEYDEAFEYDVVSYGEVNIYLACVFLMNIIKEETIQPLKIKNLISNVNYIDNLFNILNYTFETASTKDLKQLLGEYFSYYNNYINPEILNFKKSKLLNTLN